MVAKRQLANLNNGKSDCDNSVNIRSSSSSSFERNANHRFLRSYMRSISNSTSTAMVVLLFLIAFSSTSMISLVLSFPLHQPHHYSGKDTTFAKQLQLQRIESTRFPTGTINNKNKKHLPIHTKLGAASAENDVDDDDKDTTATTIRLGGTDDGYDGLGEYDPSENLPKTQREVPNVGDPQLRVKEKDWSVTDILKELAAIQQKGPQKYCILGTRHCSYLHQQIIELLAYALVLSGNHVYTSGAPGTNAATVRGALRAEREDLLTVVLPQSLEKQTKESQELLEKVDDLITMPQNDDMSLDVASRICNSYLLSLTDQLVSFAFHESTTVIEANKEAKALDMLVTTLYLD